MFYSQVVWGGVEAARSNVIKSCPTEWAAELFDMLVQNGIEHPEMTTFDSLIFLLRQNRIAYSDSDLKQLMHVFGTWSEYYLRQYFRKKVITTLVNSQFRVCIAGSGWDNLYAPCPNNLTLAGEVEFTATAEMTANAKIVLNVMPWFKEGIHDRILTAIMNGSVCVTDSSSYIDAHFEDGKDIVLYSLNNLKMLPLKINYLLQNPDKAKEIIHGGQDKVQNNYSWKFFVIKNILEPWHKTMQQIE